MSYCINPACPNPDNPDEELHCLTCGSSLLFHDRYRVIKALGQGGFGATFLAKIETLPGEPKCVIKQLRPAITTPHVLQMARELFAREAKTLGKVGDHPQVPQLLDYFEVDQQFYLVQEYVSGATLKQEVKRSGPFTEFEVKKFLREILPVLQYIHSKEVIHRDIKPANILRRNLDNKLVLIDFGAVKDQVNQTTVAGGTGQTAFTNFAIGTQGFAPPEQMALRPVYASDIYALGVTCIYLLTGKSPIELDYDMSTGEMRWRERVDVSPGFAKILEKMLEVSVRHRYQSATEMIKVLELENHGDSLSQSMISGRLHNNPEKTPGNSDANSGGSGGSSPTSRMAQAIRERNARMSGATHLQPGASRNRIVASSPGSGMANNKANGETNAMMPQKWDEDSLRVAYTKGRKDFATSDLRNLNLQKYRLIGVNFYQSKLDKTNLQGAELSKANFGQASLREAILKDANLNEAYFTNANLEKADLRGADLTNAYLSNANLRGANLCGANLTGARISDEQLAMAKTNWLTIKPDGKKGFW